MDIYDKILNAVKTVVKNKTSGYDTPAVVTRIEGDTAWVHIDGGVDETPVDKSIACKKGDSVRVRLSGGGAFITGNDTRPPTDDATALIAESKAEQSYSKAVSADEKAIVAENRAIDAKYTAESILVYDHTYTVENNIATFVAYLYRGGLDVKNLYSSDLFTWYLKTESGTTYLGTGYTKSVNLNACGYGAEVIGRFHNDDDELLAYNGNNLTDVNDTPLTGRANGEATRVRDLEVVTTLDDGEKFMIVGNDDEHLITASTLAEYLGSQTTETDPIFSASPASGISANDIIAWNNKSDFSGSYNDLTNKPTNVSAFTNDAGYIAEDSNGDISVTRNIEAGNNIWANGTISTDSGINSDGDLNVLGDFNIDGTQVITGSIWSDSDIEADGQMNCNGDMNVGGSITAGEDVQDGYGNVLANKQETLVSGTNIKTINNTSLLGSGNISISGGGVTGVKGNSESTYRTGNVNLTYGNIGALPDYTLSIYDGTGGNPRVDKFCTIDYSGCDSNNGVLAKIGMRAGHGNGTSYNELQDVIISVGYTGTISVNIYRYYAGSITYDSTTHYYGDVLYTNDTTNKVAKFYVLGGQYAYIYMMPWQRLHTSSKGTVTQHTGSAVRDLSGTYSWANVFWLDGSTKQDKLVSGTNIKTVNSNSLLGSGNVALTASDVGAVPTSRTINGKALSSNVTLKTSDITNDSGYITGYTETDPTVPSWAKASSKPSYTASEVGALPLSGGTLTGTLKFTENSVEANFRPANADYYSTISHLTSGNEATVFATKNGVTSFMFVNGEDSVTNHASNRWQSLTPALQIKNNKVAIGKLIANGVTPTYALDVNGTVNATSFEGSGSNLTGVVHTETDPTVPSWAKASSKPSYTASEVGAVPTSRTVNGHALTGNVAVTASDLSIVDYITSKGHDSSGKWFYTRWASGKEEAWGTISSGTLTMSASGSLYRATGKSITVPSGVLNNTPTFVEVNAMYSSAVFVNAMGSASSKTALSVQIWKSTNATAAVDLMIHTVYYPSSY